MIQYESIERLKREAKRMRKSRGISHNAALDLLAKARGFTNWSQLIKAQGADFTAAGAK